MTAKKTVPEDAAESQDGSAPRRRRRFGRISIQSKLLLMLLATSIISAAVVGYIGFQNGHTALRASVFEALTETRESQARQLGTTFANLTDIMALYAKGATSADAVRAYADAFDELRDEEVTPEERAAIERYYRERFGAPQSADGADEETDEDAVDLGVLMPKSNAAAYLQARYTAPFDDRAAALKVGDAGDGSAWSATNGRYNFVFREVVERFGFEDLLLLDTRGNVVYTAYKGADLGTNILTGPYRGTALKDAYNKVLDSNAADYVAVADFDTYLPSDEPTAWMVAGVGPPDRLAGVLAVKLPISGINDLLTNDKDWEAAGMGKTGETIIVGDDLLMRSNSRLFLEDPDTYKQDVIEAGTPPDIPEEAIRRGGTALIQPAGTEATELAQRGETGTLIAPDYLGHETLQAYKPVDLGELHWSIITKIDTAEAFAPVNRFTRVLLQSTVAIIFVVCMAALLLARLFVRPLRRLESGVQRIGAGDYEVSLPVTTRDEFGDLTHAFNEMSRNLQIKEQLLQDQREENERLLLSLMPEPVAERYRDGEDDIAQDHQDVTVIFGKVEGLDELTGDLPVEDSLAAINALIRQFDGAAESLGLEKVRTLHTGYLASCGLSVPRLDNVRRVLDFAVEMRRIIDRYNGETGRQLRLRAGINTGTVTSGLLGRSNLVYDMWGAAVNLVYQVQHASPEPGIYVTGTVYERMRDSREFVDAGRVTVDDTTEPIWRLVDEAR